jgi:hypothetical protein
VAVRGVAADAVSVADRGDGSYKVGRALRVLQFMLWAPYPLGTAGYTDLGALGIGLIFCPITCAWDPASTDCILDQTEAHMLHQETPIPYHV